MRLGLGLHITGLRAGGFSPASLFAGGESGAWFEPSPSTCFTDTGGTTAASVGDPVARINDSSGNGNNATQATAASRPILRQTAGGLYYLEFDGVDDAMATGSIDFSVTAQITTLAGISNNSGGTAFEAVLETSPNAFTNAGAFGLYSPSAGDLVRARTRGVTASQEANGGTVTTGTLFIASGLHDLTGDTTTLRINGVQEALATTPSSGGGNFQNYSLNFGARDGSSEHFDGDIYCAIIRGALTSGADLTNAESYVADKTGVTL